MSSHKNIWGQLFDICKELQVLMYVKHDLRKAKGQLSVLENLIVQLPQDDETIIGAEALGMYHELREELDLALKHRKREVQLMERLYQDIRNNDYDDDTKQYLLSGRDLKDLEQRIKIIRDLEHRIN